MADKYDAIIIGSGVGGLTCGAFLTRAGMRVLVLEQHTKIGGYAHSFKRKRFVFESGIHSVPMSKNGLIFHLLRLLGVDNKVEAVEHPEMYSVSLPEFSMAIPSRKDEIFEFLQRNFTDQKDNIRDLFMEADMFYKNIVDPIFNFENTFQEMNREFVTQYHNRSYSNFIRSIIRDEKLKLLLFGQWPYVGSSPDYSPNLFTFMMFLVHIIEGSHCCKGGFSTLASSLASVIIDGGGTIERNSRVISIIVEKKHARGICLENNNEIEADVVVSNISPYLVHNKMLNEEYQSRRWKKRITNLRPSVSSVIVYLGLNQKVDAIIPHNIHFWYDSSDYKKIFHNILNNKKENIDHLIFLKNFEKKNQTLTLMNFVQKSFSLDWKSEKKKVAEMMLNKAEEIFPGFKSLIEVIEIGSPTTFERYTSNIDGALYGFENTKSMYGEAKMPITTHIDNLFQTGHWGKPGCSVWNVMSNAYTASKIILK